MISRNVLVPIPIIEPTFEIPTDIPNTDYLIPIDPALASRYHATPIIFRISRHHVIKKLMTNENKKLR